MAAANKIRIPQESTSKNVELVSKVGEVMSSTLSPDLQSVILCDLVDRYKTLRNETVRPTDVRICSNKRKNELANSILRVLTSSGNVEIDRQNSEILLHGEAIPRSNIYKILKLLVCSKRVPKRMAGLTEILPYIPSTFSINKNIRRGKQKNKLD